MKKIKEVLYDIAVAITSVALVLMMVTLAISGAIWGMNILLRVLGVI